jgi:hypothetical protein
MFFLFSFVCAIAAVVMGWRYWSALEDRDDFSLRLWFALWLGQGVLLPLALWNLLDWLWRTRPRAVATAAMQGVAGVAMPVGWNVTWPSRSEIFSAWWPASGFEALLFLISIWAAVNFAWILGTAAPRVENRRSAWLMAGLMGLLVLPFALPLALVVGVPAIGWSVALWLGVMAHMLVGACDPVPIHLPSYSGAVGHLKRGRFDQAEEAILEQLERVEDDYSGWMMLAELYAVHFRDLPTADRTVHDLCAQPNVNASQIAASLHKLADWYLAVDDNPVAARSVVEEIELLYPNTHLAFMAGQRLRRLPASRAEWQASKRVSTIPLRPGPAATPGFALLVSSDAEFAPQRAEELSAKLTGNPADARAREEFARLLEGPLKQPDAAMAQLRLLLGLRGPSDEQRGEWLNLLATWQLRHQLDGVAGRRTFDQVIREHAGTAAADHAAKRLQMLALEDRLRGVSSGPTVAKRPGPIRVKVPTPSGPTEVEEPPPPKWD